MKSLSVLLLLFLLGGLAMSARATTNLVNGFYVITNPPPAPVMLSWDLEPSANRFNVYFGTSPGNYGSVRPAGNTNFFSVQLPTGGITYYFAVTAVSADNLESAFSSEVSYAAPGPPPIPTGVRPPVKLSLQYKHLLTDPLWADTGIVWSWDPRETNAVFQLSISQTPLVAQAAQPLAHRISPALPPAPGQ